MKYMNTSKRKSQSESIKKLFKNKKHKEKMEKCYSKRRLNLNIEELKIMYINERKSAEDIGRIYGCSGEIILIRLRQCNIPIRSASETNRITQS